MDQVIELASELLDLLDDEEVSDTLKLAALYTAIAEISGENYLSEPSSRNSFR